MAVDSVSVSGKKEKKIKSPKKKENKSQTTNVAASPPAKTVKSPGVRVVGGRIYDPVNGKTCHQCRQKTMDFAAACQNKRNNKPCTLMLCRKCLLNRYGEEAEEVAASGDWNCPKCRGICNCSVCMKRKGHEPTGSLISTAKATGFSSVSEMLASPKAEVALSPRKRGKENSIDGKLDANVPSPVAKKSKKVKLNDDTSLKKINQSPVKRKLKQDGDAGVSPKKSGLQGLEKKPKKTKRDRLDEMTNGKNNEENSKETTVHDEKKQKKSRSDGLEKKPKKTKRDRSDEMNNGKNNEENLKETTVHDGKKQKKSKSDGLKENGVSNKKDAILARRTSPRKLADSNRKLADSNKMPNQGEKLNNVVDLEGKVNSRKSVTKKDLVGSFENDKKKDKDGNNADDKNVLKHQSADIQADITLPLGKELTSVAGIDVCAEDVGSALQFLEFCAVFGKILEVKKGQPEYVLRDLLHGRTARRGKFSSTVQFHIHLLSIIQTEQGEEFAELSPSYGKKSWFHALKDCLAESKSVLKAQELDSLEKESDYETLSASQKLRVLNILCDEVLQTEKVRDWMDDQNKELAEKAKEARQMVLAAKDKEKSFKQKTKDDIAKAVIAKNGDNLSISEHDAIVSKIKTEAAEARAKVLQLEAGMLKYNQTPEAVRIEPIFIGGSGDAYWKLNCSGKSNVLRQNVGKGDTLTLDEKWFAIDDEGKETIEKHICSLREKRLRAPRVRNAVVNSQSPVNES